MALCICMMNSPQKRREQGGVMRLNKFRPNRRQPEVLRGRKLKSNTACTILRKNMKFLLNVFLVLLSLLPDTIEMIVYKLRKFNIY
ncbi:MAG: hypothetical protein C6W56_13355 [Caldibacillus debilis]|nr:MAG: hypothetical protein C6W56_13355 [Caldibacillus debilis]